MGSFTNKDIEFLSNRELIDILNSLLKELDLVASSGAHRSTTYLAASAIEGLFGELLKLLDIQPGDVPGIWPNNKNSTTPKTLKKLKFHEKEKILDAAGALPADFEKLYAPVRVFRNYMHTDRELKEQTPIAQSIGQLALACLNALIEKYASQRFVATQVWEVMSGFAQVQAANVIQMPQKRGDKASVLVSKLPAERHLEVTCHVIIPPGAIFNFVYNFLSLDSWMAARIEGREGRNERGADNGVLHCTKWPAWAVVGRYTTESEPDPKIREHTVKIVLNPPQMFALTVNDVPLELQGGVGWDFDSKGKIGFMTEIGLVSVTDLEVQTR